MVNRELTETMIADLIDLGNLFSGLKWPSVETDINWYDANTIYKNLMADYEKVKTMETDYHDALNELRLHCGNYQQEHKGACDDCRWLKPRRGW